jgi:hypothetical protein
MSAYVVFFVAAAVAFAASNYLGATVAWIGAGIFSFGAISRGRLYLLTRHHPIPDHRRSLDRLVVAQWAVVAAAGIGVGVVTHYIDYRPLDHAPPLVHVIVIGALIISSGVFVSSLVDWYWILPRLAGLGGYPAPCEDSGSEQWSSITSVWYFHRAAATALVAAVATGIPIYMTSITDDGAQHAAWDIAVLAVGGLAGFFSRQSLRAGYYAFNPPIHVGDAVRVRLDRYDFEPHDVYIADVALQGSKFKELQSCEYRGRPFRKKGDGDPIDNATLKRVKPLPDCGPPCGKRCTGVNWYCRNNPLAHSQSAQRRANASD